MKPCRIRRTAKLDISRVVAFYKQEAGEDVALNFMNAVEDALRHLTLYPGSGSRRFGVMIDIPHLRSWLLTKFPYTLFYGEHDDYLEVMFLLHQNSDIVARLQSNDMNIQEE